MIITHNMLAMNTERQLGMASAQRAKTLEKLSSGYRINRAADDAAGLAISEKMRAQIRGLVKGSQNVQNGMGFCNVADGALQEVHALIGRIRELSVQAASDTYVEIDRLAIENEFAELKKEINNISRSTEYNTRRIFDDGHYEVEFSGAICPIKIFNADYKSPADSSVYGGIIIGDDVRVAWNDIAPGMVSVDAATGEMMFNAGEYHFTMDDYKMTFFCDEGTKPPEIKVEFTMSANGEGLRVGGNVIEWEDIINEDGESILDHTGEAGHYSFRYGDQDGGFYVEAGMSLSDIISGINYKSQNGNKQYLSVYNGSYTTKAVELVDAGSRVQLTQDMYDAYLANNNQWNDFGYELRADEDGIWVVKDGVELTNSKKTWTELTLGRWDSGNDVSDQKKYTYVYEVTQTDANGGTRTPQRIEYDFFLLDETSRQSVIDAINGVKLEGEHYVNANETTAQIETQTENPTSNIISASLKNTTNVLTLEEELALGRDLSLPEQTLVDEKQLESYDATATNPQVTWEMDSNHIFTSSYMPSVSEMAEAANVPLQYLIAKSIKAAYAQGTWSPGAQLTLDNSTLVDVLGSDKIAAAENPNKPGIGYLSETYKIEMGTTVGSSTIAKTTAKNSYKSIENNKEYPAASIDFSGLGTDYQLYDLLGTGFDSTCMTCDRHYSTMFVYGGATAYTANGFGYSLTKNTINNPSGNYVLQIDIKSMQEKGITESEGFTKALIDIIDNAKCSGSSSEGDMFVGHYTQYATDGEKLYICDNRPEYLNSESTRKDSEFYIEPYNAEAVEIDLQLQNADGRRIELEYLYDIVPKLGNITMNMQPDANGFFVMNPDTTSPDTYIAYDPAIHDASMQRYNLAADSVTDDVWKGIYDSVMSDIVSKTKLSVEATDYVYLECDVEENPNEAYVSRFHFEVEEKEEEGMWIQAGANEHQGMFMKWDGFSTHFLGLATNTMLTRESASQLITRCDMAIQKISKTRSAFGAYTNRLEKMYSMNQNYMENLQAAESKLRDADIAHEMLVDAKYNILMQTSQAMLAHAKQNGKEF